MQTIQQLEAYAEQLRTEIARKKSNPYAVQQVADRERELAAVEDSIRIRKS